MPTYQIITLGCRVNHYESLQVEELLRELGYTPAEKQQADLVIVNTCSVTSAAAAKSRNLLRRHARRGTSLSPSMPQTIGIGCWTTSDPKSARDISGNVLVLGHQDDVAEQIRARLASRPAIAPQPPTSPLPACAPRPGTVSLPQLNQRQAIYQRALLKVQDGCDAHCTYCIIPKLRPILWTRPVEEVVAEARRMVLAGHREIVLTGVFLGAYGQPTALHRRQRSPGAGLAQLVRALCTQVDGLLRLRLSSLEPGDVSSALIDELASHQQVMPHFHVPLQSGSDEILRRMNRQYTADEYDAMVEAFKSRFDRPALTTDIIVGFPGESDADFDLTLQRARSIGFLHVHAFPYSARDGTAAARWKDRHLPSRILSERMAALEEASHLSSLAYRASFVGQHVQVLVEHRSSSELPLSAGDLATLRHGRCERYFAVNFDAAGPADLTGALAEVQITRVAPDRTHGELIRTLI